MFRRIHAYVHGLPLARMGFVVLLLAGLVEALDRLGEIDLSPVITWLGGDPAFWIALIGIAKIVLRLVLYMLPPPQPKAQ